MTPNPVEVSTKVDWTVIYTLITALISNLILLGIFIWRLSKWETRLVIKIDRNKEDINALGNSLRKKIERANHYQNVQILHIARFLEETTDNYRHPTMNDYDSHNPNSRD